ncbi:MAG TPA: hypothetical protein DD381_01325 [Lentisphaeria bacterium]|nr:MAG: hypothetical protein A2X47_10705 [Lentisphaerae bacterium GWF2_38_69]HBM14985.1 hypothetical protein [Lentisphaeria bacterium]
MNLRARKSTLRRDLKENKKGNNIFVKVVIYLAVIAALILGVFGSAVYFNGQSQRLNREIAVNETEIYKLDREIQNLKFSIEIKSKRDYIFEKIAQNNLGLRPADPNQIVKLIPSVYDFKNETFKAKKIAYSAKNPKNTKIVSD